MSCPYKTTGGPAAVCAVYENVFHVNAKPYWHPAANQVDVPSAGLKQYADPQVAEMAVRDMFLNTGMSESDINSNPRIVELLKGVKSGDIPMTKRNVETLTHLHRTVLDGSPAFRDEENPAPKVSRPAPKAGLPIEAPEPDGSNSSPGKPIPDSLADRGVSGWSSAEAEPFTMQDGRSVKMWMRTDTTYVREARFPDGTTVTSFNDTDPAQRAQEPFTILTRPDGTRTAYRSGERPRSETPDGQPVPVAHKSNSVLSREAAPGTGYEVSTVRLETAYGQDTQGRPLAYETMVFGKGDAEGAMMRWSTAEEAMAGHHQTLRALSKVENDDDSDKAVREAAANMRVGIYLPPD